MIPLHQLTTDGQRAIQLYAWLTIGLLFVGKPPIVHDEQGDHDDADR